MRALYTEALRSNESASSGAHLQPLVAASQAERRKHASYDAECAKHGWKLVPFVFESLGAKGGEARQLLQRMAAHSVDKSPQAFLAHADCDRRMQVRRHRLCIVSYDMYASMRRLAVVYRLAVWLHAC